MVEEEQKSAGWYWNILIAISVIGTVLFALLLAQIDNLQKRARPLPPAFSANATIIAATQTQLAPVALSSATPTDTPPPGTPITNLPINCGLIPPTWAAYLVKPGETLASIARQYGLSPTEIVQANCTLPENVIAGIYLFVPDEPPCGPPFNWVTYIVQPGDTIYSLSAATHIQTGQFTSANCLRAGDILYEGAKVYLPFHPATATPPPTKTRFATAIPLPTNTLPPPTSPPPDPTDTSVPTAVPSSTPTPTLPATASPTATTIASPTSTSTPPASPSPSPTITATSTLSPTATATTTATYTPSPTLAPTDTPTNTPVPTAVPTNTSSPPPTNTPSATATAVPSSTPTSTPTLTATPTETATP